LFFALMAVVAAAAFAAGFTDADYAYLRDHWGLKRDGTAAKNLTAAEQAELHRLINDPFTETGRTPSKTRSAIILSKSRCAPIGRAPALARTPRARTTSGKADRRSQLHLMSLGRHR
jgi:hypothetical protein